MEETVKLKFDAIWKTRELEMKSFGERALYVWGFLTLCYGAYTFLLYQVVSAFSLISPGGGTDQEAKESVREAESSYPSAVGTFKIPLPAYGLFVRHAQGVSIENFSCRLMSPDARPERKVVED